MRLARADLLWGTALVVAASAQAAEASTVTLDRTCYSPGEAIGQVGSAFTAGGAVTESLDLLDPLTREPLGSFAAEAVTADAQGAFSRQIAAPPLARDTDRRESAVSSFSDGGAPAGVAPAVVEWTLSSWEVRIRAWAHGRARPGRSMVIDTTGWTSAGGTLHAHYFRRRTPVGVMRIGTLTGDCGDLRKKVRQFPFKHVRPGRWTVYFSGTAVLDTENDAWIRHRVRVAR